MIDEIDWKILKELQANARITFAELGRRVGLTTPAVDYSHIIEVAEQSKEVMECHRGTGGDSFILKVAVADVEHLQSLIDRLTPYGITTTSIVLSSPVKRRIIEAKAD
jgi:Lrp/AsnC family leucine-responsive transcriptional regulator